MTGRTPARRMAVIGAGSWGTAVASLAARNVETVLWARRPETADEINTRHTNETYLGAHVLPSSIEATADLGAAVERADIVVMGVPSHGFRDVMVAAAPMVAPGVPIISLTKGVEQGTQLRMTEVVAQVLPEHPVGVLSGPNLAREIVAGQPALSTVAMNDEGLAAIVQQALSSDRFRVYTNPDVVGCELAGALKNVMAIAAGMVDGLGFGDNTKAALITRGLAELARLGSRLGGKTITFGGLAGIGDLVATCVSPQSRNRHVGEQLGRGRVLDEIVADMHMVAEGVKSSMPALELARRLEVDVPIIEQVVAVVHQGQSAKAAVSALMSRPVGAELRW